MRVSDGDKLLLIYFLINYRDIPLSQKKTNLRL